MSGNPVIWIVHFRKSLLIRLHKGLHMMLKELKVNTKDLLLVVDFNDGHFFVTMGW